MKKYKYLLFDADETLLDFSKASDCAFKNLLNYLEIDYSKELKDKYEEINLSLWKQFELGEVDINTVLVERFARFFDYYEIFYDKFKAERIYQNYLSEGAYLIPGAISVLEKLKNDYSLYIITNGVAKTQRKRLEKLDLYKYFDKIFISEEMNTRKPKSDFFDIVTRTISDPSLDRYLVIGDSLSSDIKGGFDYGIDTCFINMKKNKKIEANPTYVVNKIAEVLNVLE